MIRLLFPGSAALLLLFPFVSNVVAQDRDAPSRSANALRATSQPPATSQAATPETTSPAPQEFNTAPPRPGGSTGADLPPPPPTLQIPSVGTPLLEDAAQPLRNVSQNSQTAPSPVTDSVLFESPANPEVVLQDDYWCESEYLGAPRQFYVQLDYLNWWTKGMNVPALVTTAPSAAELPLPTGTILFGNRDYFTDVRNGGRLRIGSDTGCWWCGGWEIEYFALNQEWLHFAAASGNDGLPFLGRPFFNINPKTEAPAAPGTFIPDPPAREDAELVSEQRPDGELLGVVTVDLSTSLVGVAARWRCNIASNDGIIAVNDCGDVRYASIVNFVAGYRYLRLNEGLLVTEDLTDIDRSGSPTVITEFDIYDRFRTMNEFNGMEVGAEWLTHHRDWTMTLTGRLALGDIQQTVFIDGQTAINGGVGPGGLLAQTSNMGLHQRNVFGVIPELEMRVTKQVTQHIRFSAGYNLLYMSRVVRPGDQIDRDINPDLFPSGAAPMITGPLRPVFAFHDSDYWAHGLSLGMDFVW